MSKGKELAKGERIAGISFEFDLEDLELIDERVIAEVKSKRERESYK